jgi:hypothetical protein
MSLTAERPDVLERLGGALNSSDLSPDDERVRAIDLIAALAYTQINPDGAEHDALEVAPIDPRTELAAVLVRLKYAGDRELGNRAAILLGHWVRRQKAFGKWRIYPGQLSVLDCFVRQSLAEWLYPVCQVCSGREALGTARGEVVQRRVRCTRCEAKGWLMVAPKESKSGARHKVRRDCLSCNGRGWNTLTRVRQEKARECYACMGTGRQRPNDAERARVLGLEHRIYQRHWQRRFDWLAAGLDRLDRLVKRSLQMQMRGV